MVISAHVPKYVSVECEVFQGCDGGRVCRARGDRGEGCADVGQRSALDVAGRVQRCVPEVTSEAREARGVAEERGGGAGQPRRGIGRRDELARGRSGDGLRTRYMMAVGK